MSTTPKPAASAPGQPQPQPQPPKKLAGAEFVYRPRFKNDLPPLPFDPKSLKLDLNHFADDLNVKYHLGLFDASEYAFDPLQADKKLRDAPPTHMHDPLDADLFINPDSVLSGSIKSDQHIKLRLPTGAVPAASNAIDGDFSSGTQSASQRSARSSSGAAAGTAGANARWTSRMRRLTTKDANDQIAVIQSTFDAAAAASRHTRANQLHIPQARRHCQTHLAHCAFSPVVCQRVRHVDLPAGSGTSAAARAARARSASPERDPLPRGAVLRTADVPHQNMDAHALQMFAVHLPAQAVASGQDPLDMPVADPTWTRLGVPTRSKDSYTNPDTLLHLALRVPRTATYLPTVDDGAPVVTTMATSAFTPAEYVPIKSRIEMKRARVMKPGATYADYEAAVHAGGGIPVADPKGRTAVYMVPLGEASVGGKAVAFENGIGVGFEEAERLAAAGLKDWVQVPGSLSARGGGQDKAQQSQAVDMVQSLDDNDDDQDAALLFGDEDDEDV
ncbi:hypothetical protein BCR44DRAFT_1428291 [Catenaria anguillulae PL171]|uniref:RNA polymerase II-associated n=1 Tax=Catenaria anguillulae PL171 TaxID=765915 RepID=A0A1Y2HXI3_9FUNG|nr:hypothetical protein BCR44DRAFT_1428291 [Catenaria anguillulae PL171]